MEIQKIYILPSQYVGSESGAEFLQSWFYGSGADLGFDFPQVFSNQKI